MSVFLCYRCARFINCVCFAGKQLNILGECKYFTHITTADPDIP